MRIFALKNLAKNKKPAAFGKYLAAGIVAAAVIFALIKVMDKDDAPVPHIWSPEVDSAFVYNCVGKYSKEFGRDSIKLKSTAEFCICMLEKVKLKYDESEMNKVTDSDIREWDRLCRNELMYKNRVK